MGEPAARASPSGLALDTLANQREAISQKRHLVSDWWASSTTEPCMEEGEIMEF